jgi:hypothetical protein
VKYKNKYPSKKILYMEETKKIVNYDLANYFEKDNPFLLTGYRVGHMSTICMSSKRISSKRISSIR